MEIRPSSKTLRNEIERKNANNKQVGQIVSSINNIHIACNILTQAQTKGKQIQNEATPSGEDSSQLVKSLKTKLSKAVNKIDVLKNLDPEYTTERYYDESAKLAMMLSNSNAGGAAAAGSSYGGAAAMNSQMAKSDMPAGSQVTSTNITQREHRIRAGRKHWVLMEARKLEWQSG